MGKIFLNWITEDALLQVFSNWQKFSAWVMDNKPEYIHGGHLIDIAGYPKFKELILDRKSTKLKPRFRGFLKVYGVRSNWC